MTKRQCVGLVSPKSFADDDGPPVVNEKRKRSGEFGLSACRDTPPSPVMLSKFDAIASAFAETGAEMQIDETIRARERAALITRRPSFSGFTSMPLEVLAGLAREWDAIGWVECDPVPKQAHCCNAMRPIA